MELPADVMVHNELVGMKGNPGSLLAVSDHGFYELNCSFGDKVHRILLPIASTVLIAREPESQFEDLEIER